MRVEVDFQDESLELEIPDEQVVATWRGPAGTGQGTGELTDTLRAALEAPRDYPALRQAVVPGDRVTIALDPAIPAWRGFRRQRTAQTRRRLRDEGR